MSPSTQVSVYISYGAAKKHSRAVARSVTAIIGLLVEANLAGQRLFTTDRRRN